MSDTSSVLRPGVRAAVWMVIGLSIAGTVVAIVWGQRVATPVPGTRDSYADAPLGSRAFLETLEALGMHVLRERRGDFARVRAPVLFVEPEGVEAIVDGERVTLVEALRERSEAGVASIVVLPKWRYDLGQASPDDEADEVLSAVLPGAALVHMGALSPGQTTEIATGALGTYEISIPWLQTIRGGDVEVLLAHDDSGIVVRRADGVLVVSDPDLVHNWNLQRADHARIALDVVREAGEGDAVAIDEVFHGHGERRSLGAALGEVPTVYVTAHALGVLLLVVWIGSRRFGRAQGLAKLGHGPAESIAVSAFVLSEGRPIETLAARYVHEQLADLAERLGLAAGRSPAEQAAHVDRVAARRGVEKPSAASLLARAGALGRSPAEALALCQAAHDLRVRLFAHARS